MDEERILRDQTVVVANGKIVHVGPTSAVKVPDGAVRVDATGRYLLPALCDMHVHLLGPSWTGRLSPDAQLANDAPYERFLLPYIASGVTTVQVLSGTPEDVTVRGRIDRGELLGPRLILARMIDGPEVAWPPPLSTWVSSAEEAREAVRRAKEEGYDKMKVYSFLNQESYDAIVSTANELGMDVIGHVPMSVSLEYVLDAGQKLIAHSEEVAKHAGGQYDDERVDYFATRMAGSGVWMTPTLVTTRTLLEVMADPDGLYTRPETAYFRHPAQVGVWSFMVDRLYRPVPVDKQEELRQAFEEFQLPLTKAFHDKGGTLMAGSDSLMPGVLAGFDLHREIQELVDVGLTPYEALRTATANPFEYLGESDKAGTIAVGKQSDLLLLDANPLEDVSAASKIAGVLVRGRWIGADELHKKMKEIAAP
ncbi:MAG: amidohydrolase family protein [Polyangiaceae bacterium]|nr:amidohydrolase family protein [Polyangiaceae bacterium]